MKMMLVLYVAQFLAEISDKNGVETKAGEAGDSVVGSVKVCYLLHVLLKDLMVF